MTDPESPLVSRHLRVGLHALAAFVLLGIALEALHAWKSPFYLDAGHETTRLLLRLAHAHGTLIAILHVVFALVVRARPSAATGFASIALTAALVLVPGGFLLGGLFAHAGDPGLGALLVPPGALLLFAAIARTATKIS